MTLPEILALAAAISTSFVQWIKQIKFIPSWTYPLFAIVFGILIVMLGASIGAPHVVFNSQVVLYGIIAGFTACGLYSSVTSTSNTVSAAIQAKKAANASQTTTQ